LTEQCKTLETHLSKDRVEDAVSKQTWLRVLWFTYSQYCRSLYSRNPRYLKILLELVTTSLKMTNCLSQCTILYIARIANVRLAFLIRTRQRIFADPHSLAVWH
jgi:hypothetical protein